MNDNNITIENAGAGARRLRPNNIEEQAEMVRLARHLLGTNVTREELQKHLGYSSAEELETALTTGRASTLRLQRLREFADARLPDILKSKSDLVATANTERADALAARLRRHAEQASDQKETHRVEAPKTAHFSRKGMKRERRKDYLTPKQQERLRSQIEHLWAVDKRFDNWSLLAHIAGLSSGPAIKRAYEVGSSATTLKHIDNFVRIFQAFGGRALEAAKQGIDTDDLQKHLMSTGPRSPTDIAAPTLLAISENETGVPAHLAQSSQTEMHSLSAQSASQALNDLPSTPPSIDFANLVAVAAAVETELKRLWLSAEMFQDLANEPTMPSIIRHNAKGAAEKLRDALEFFAPAQPTTPRT